MSLTRETEPFFARYADRVIFGKGHTKSEPLDVLVRFNRLAPQVISGEVLGTPDTYDKLEPVFEAKGDAYCAITSACTDAHLRLSSSTLFLRSISTSSPRSDRSPHAALRVVGEFTCEEILIDESGPGDGMPDHEALEAVFHLTGSTMRWAGGGLSKRTWTEFSIGSRETQIAPGVDYPFTIAAGPILVYDETLPFPNRSTIRAERSLTVRCRMPQSVDGYTTFAKDAEAIVEDILLLMSYVSRTSLDWHTREHGRSTLVRARAASPRRGMEDLNSPIPIQHNDAFLTLAIPRLRALRQAGVDLRLPILYLVQSHITPVADTQLSYAVLCLERLADIHGRTHDLQEIVAATTFNRIRTAVSDEIKAVTKAETEAERFKSKYPADQAVELMRSKISELKRPPIGHVIDHLCAHYDVAWTDLYPPNTPKPTFLDTRNKFIHSSEPLHIKRMVREARRIQAFCERIIAKMLGWAEPWTPGGYQTKWLADPAED